MSEARRTRITSPRRSVRGPRSRDQLDPQSGLGEVYLNSLRHAQLRLSLFFFAGLVAAAAAVPLLLTLDPGLADVELWGVRLPWLVLGGAVFPALVGCGWVYVRAAERTEQEFVELLDEP
ncbi:MAG TPA: hypothetical protein VFN19_04595 [Candidatus Nanopelagicales bacterium]|jgi:hypothetical protein|nr:hypothetical protein [Candidatus Nanopelagicales bacterium]